MPPRSSIRTIYLYLLSLIGIVMVVIGGAGFVNMALKAFLFTEADTERFMYAEMPPKPLGERPGDPDGFRDSVQARRYQEALDRWLERRESVDPQRAQRHRDAASNLSFILIGLPLYLYHWRLVRRDQAGAGFAGENDA